MRAQALASYTEALADKGYALRATVLSNRAQCYLRQRNYGAPCPRLASYSR